MTPSRPYLLRAFYNWINDNQLTAYVLVDAVFPGTDVPTQYIEDGQIILNIAPRAVQTLDLNNENIAFTARFNGIPHDIFIPMRAVKAIYAKENGKGMVFKEDDMPPLEDDSVSESGSTGNTDKSGDKGKAAGKKTGRPNLTIVK